MTSAPRTVASLAVVALAAAILSGCGTTLPWDNSSCDKSHKINIGFVIGHRANAPAPQILPDIQSRIVDGIRSNGDYVTISADGEPFVYDHNFLGSDRGDGGPCTTQQDDAIRDFPATLTQTPGVTDEADILKALALAADGIRDKDGVHELIVIDNGLQTKEPLNFAIDDRLYAYTPEKFVANITQQDGMPDLSGMTVYWSGMGGVIPPQEPLTIEAQNSLEAVWRLIIEEAGGSLEVLSEPLAPLDPAVTSTVTPIPIRPETGLPKPLVITEDNVRFVPDTADFANPAAASAFLNSVASRINEDQSGGLITVTGVTDDYGTMEHQLDISLQRATTVLNQLVTLGVPSERLQADGLGSDWACFNPNDSDANRKVIITSSSQSPEDVCR
jgi:outer membrane protein OmpA-like peptidoglycan-associated protein